MIEWPLGKRIAFRFGVLFGALTVLPFPLAIVPVIGPWFENKLADAWAWLADLIGRHVFGTGPLELVMTGSGDTTLAWVALAMTIALAALGTIAWSILDRRRPAYPRLAAIARVVLRYWLATIMLSYGLAKVFVLQFPAPSLARLYEPIGHMSPMGLLWTFMGASPPYRVFAGLMECLGGALLLWRATTPVGALLLVPVMTNVVILNFCYDVPVKVYSSELLAAAIVLLAPDLPRLVAVLRGRAVPNVMPPPQLPQRWAIAKIVAKVLVIGWLGYQQIHDTLGAPKVTPSSLAGAWQVDRVDGGGEPRWKLLVISGRSALIRTTDDRDRIEPITDDDGTYLKLGVLGRAGAFLVTRTGDHLVLTGVVDGKSGTLELHALDDADMLLVHRGFHWIQERPFNK